MSPENALRIAIDAMMRAVLDEPAMRVQKTKAKKPPSVISRETKPDGLHSNPDGLHSNPDGLHSNPEGLHSNPEQLHLMPEDFPEMPRMDLPFTPSPVADDVPPVTAEELAAIENALNRDPNDAPPGMFYKEQSETPMRSFGMEE